MDQIIVAIRTFMEAGGDVLWYIAGATFVMWALIFERVLYINTEHKKNVGRALAYWEGRDERTSWHAHMIRLRLISEIISEKKTSTVVKESSKDDSFEVAKVASFGGIALNVAALILHKLTR